MIFAISVRKFWKVQYFVYLVWFRVFLSSLQVSGACVCNIRKCKHRRPRPQHVDIGPSHTWSWKGEGDFLKNEVPCKKNAIFLVMWPLTCMVGLLLFKESLFNREVCRSQVSVKLGLFFGCENDLNFLHWMPFWMGDFLFPIPRKALISKQFWATFRYSGVFD